MPEPEVAIHAAIAAVRDECTELVKTAPSQDGVRFQTILYEDVLTACREAMKKHGVVAYVADVGRLEFDTLPIGTKVHQRTRLIATVRFAHAGSNTWLDTQAVGEGTDGQGYSMTKAQTAAVKNALRFTFQLHGADEAGDESGGAPRQRTQRQQQPSSSAGLSWDEFRDAVKERGYSQAFVFAHAGDGVDADQIKDSWTPQRRAWLLTKMERAAREKK